MPPTAQEVYNSVIQTLSPTERLRLATLILNELVQQNSSVIHQSDYWTEQDQTDIVDFSLHHAASLFSGERMSEKYQGFLHSPPNPPFWGTSAPVLLQSPPEWGI
ncbi:MAG: hypothetical protein KME11_15580 [Timaviella obliquedivisa GSE-PSE-MK23-08B]|jgi:hypothetical protein|nr:hypothetical protein [Timaviella obliquedivisa GSE-PSE-MK23-08B]